MKTKYDSEQEVLDLVARYRIEINERLSDMEHKHHLADRLRDTIEAHRISNLRSEADVLLNEIAWREGRIETLIQILGEMRTKELPLNQEIIPNGIKETDQGSQN